MLIVFDSGAGGAHVSNLLSSSGVATKLVTASDLFPFGNKSYDQLLRLFLEVRSVEQGTIFCACNTMSLVLKHSGFDFASNDVIPTFPDFDPSAPVCYGTENTVRLARSMCSTFRGRAVPELVSMAEALYKGEVSKDVASDLFHSLITERVQLGSTHLSYLASALDCSHLHVEPDYVGMYLSHVRST